MMKLQVAISTMNDGIFDIKLCHGFNYIIIHQVINGKDDEYKKYVIDNFKEHKVSYIVSHETGLSKSRNLALENTSSDYLWIMDDDVLINDFAYDFIFECISNYPECGILVVSHSHKKVDFLPGEKIEFINEFKATCVSSIDMILNINKIKGVRFNEKFGLGAIYPSGEEFIFTCRLLKQKIEVIKFRRVCSYHPELVASGLDFYSSPIKLKAKKEMFKTIFGYIKGNLFYVLFLFKKIKVIIKNKALTNVFLSYF